MRAVGAAALAAGRCVGRGGAAFGRGVKQVVGMVNPDVWKEFGTVSASAYSVFLPRREAVVPRPADGFAPVVLVHGLGGNRGLWLPFRAYFRLLGRRRVYAFGYEGGTIEGHADSLVAFVEEVKSATGEPQVDLVAHSLGGIIARLAIQRHGLSDSVRVLVTLATPHQGTHAAQYANTELTLPLRPQSSLMRDLNADDLKNWPVRFVTISSDRDVYVLPHEAQTHPDARNLVIPGLAHSGHLLSLDVFRTVAELLDPLTAPGDHSK